MKIVIVVLVIMFATISHAQQRFNLEAFASKYDSIPIAVLKFKPLDNSILIENTPWEIIANDLEYSGRFKVLRTQTADSATMASNNIGVFIDGDFLVTGKMVELNCYVHDAVSGEQMYGKKFRGENEFVRSMAHRFCNQLVEMIFGEKGIFESQVLFVREKGSAKNVFMMDFDGFNIKQLTNNASTNVFPAFIDSTFIIWTSYQRGKPDIYKASIATGQSQIFIFSRYVQSSPAVSPIDGMISYASSKNGNMEIYTCNLDGTNVKQITFNRSIDTAPTWSPNGYQIAFTSDRSGQPQIYIMDADGANVHRLTFEGRYQDSPAWSPKGDKIAYTSMGSDKFDIWTINVDGTMPVQITTLPGNNEYPAWSPDGSHIIFSSKRGGQKDLYSIRTDGSQVKQITTSGNCTMPDWSRF